MAAAPALRVVLLALAACLLPTRTWAQTPLPPTATSAPAPGLAGEPAMAPAAPRNNAVAPLDLARLPAFDAQRQAAEAARDRTLVLNSRAIVSFRSSLLGRSPVERAASAQALLQAALRREGPARVSLWLDGDTAGLQLDGSIVFYLLPADLEPGSGASLASEAEAVRARLQLAVLEVKEAGDLRRIGLGLAWSALASVLAIALVRLLLIGRRRLLAQLPRLQAVVRSLDAGLANTVAEHARSAARALAAGLTWALVAVVVDVWLTFVLRQFAYTRPWGERALDWLLGLLQQFALAIVNALPGLLTAALICALARLVSRAFSGLMRRVERGEISLSGLDRDTAGPTRRVVGFVIWLFALAMAYPFLPGANSDAFKGVSVLAGLMLSLGASGVVGQVISGLSLMYSRTLRPGEFVKIGDTEGTVTVVGMFATKLHTGLGEEVSLPNAVVFSQPVRNFSRLVADGQFVLHTPVTIGYATPWRQVHAMLLEAARRTPGVAQQPAPYVVQTALSDFYVEYRLCAQSNHAVPRRRIEALNQLHGHIQDVFNENGVQIMSPHYMADPADPQLVPPARWSPELAPTATASPPAPTPPTRPTPGSPA